MVSMIKKTPSERLETYAMVGKRGMLFGRKGLCSCIWYFFNAHWYRIYQSVNQSINRSINQPIQSTNQSINQSVTHSINDWLNEQCHEFILVSVFNRRKIFVSRITHAQHRSTVGVAAFPQSPFVPLGGAAPISSNSLRRPAGFFTTFILPYNPPQNE